MPMIEFPAGVTPEKAVELARRHSPHLFADSKPGAEPLLTPAECAEKFRVDVKTTVRWAQAGKLHTIRTPGGHRRFFSRALPV